MKNLITIVLILCALTLVVSCGDDNPAESSSVTTWSGTTDDDGEVSFKTKNISGKNYLTSYSIDWSIFLGGSGTVAYSDSEGIIEIKNNEFTLSLSDDTDDFISGVIDGNTMTGNYSLKMATADPNVFSYAAGTFAAAKQ